MSIFKHFEHNDTLLERSVKEYRRMFGNDVFLKQSTGWTIVDPDDYTDYTNVGGNFLFEENSNFSLGVGKESGIPKEEILWNMIMSTIMAPWDSEDNQYNFTVGGQRVTQFVAMSLNPDHINNGFSEKMITVFSDTFKDVNQDDNFDVSTNLVLAPYATPTSMKNSFELQDNVSSALAPKWELRTSDSNEFVTLNETDNSLRVDWSKGTPSGIFGVAYPSVGLILIFPELIPATYSFATDQFGNSTDAFNALTWFGGFTYKSFDRFVYFLRLRNKDFNYSNNPTAYEFIDGREKRLAKLDLDRGGEPTTFITRVGYFNDYNECLAVGFFEHPLKKSIFDENIIISQIDVD